MIMDSGRGWGEAARNLSDFILHGKGVAVLLRAALFIVLGAGFVMSFVSFRGMLSSELAHGSPAIGVRKTAPAPELEDLLKEAEAVMTMRVGRGLFAVDAPAIRYPFAPLPSEDGTGGPSPPVLAESRPDIRVKGTMTMGSKKMAVLDIGAESGIVAEKGYVFGGGKGCVEAIFPDKVVVSWMGKREEIYVAP